MTDAPQSYPDIADKLAEISGRCSVEADRYTIIEAVGILRVAQAALKLGDIVEMNEHSPYHADWRGCRMKVVSLRIDPNGNQWVSIIEGDQRHRGNGVYDGETTDIEAEHLSVVSSTPRCTCAAIVNPNIPHARSCPLSSTHGDGK